MSWDIFIFSASQKIETIETIDESQFIPIDFDGILESCFKNITANEDHRRIEGENYAIQYSINGGPATNMMFSIYGEEGLFELAAIAKKYGWQLYDTGNGEMLDLEHPEKNGYENFKAYRDQVLNQQKTK